MPTKLISEAENQSLEVEFTVKEILNALERLKKERERVNRNGKIRRQREKEIREKEPKEKEKKKMTQPPVGDEFKPKRGRPSKKKAVEAVEAVEAE